MAHRYAIYYAPEPGSELDRLGRLWLRPDQGASPPEGFSPEERLNLTAQAAFYGFHATLKAPFRLAPEQSLEQLERAVAEFAKDRAPALGPRLALRVLDGFLALVPETLCPDIMELAWDCVRFFEPFRAPLNADELARRNRSPLTPRQEELLKNWGYPYVDDQFRFHMTLTRRLPDLEARSSVQARLSGLVRPSCRDFLAIRELCLFVQSGPDTPFRLLSSHALRGGTAVADVYESRSLT